MIILAILEHLYIARLKNSCVCEVLCGMLSCLDRCVILVFIHVFVCHFSDKNCFRMVLDECVMKHFCSDAAATQPTSLEACFCPRLFKEM